MRCPCEPWTPQRKRNACRTTDTHLPLSTVSMVCRASMIELSANGLAVTSSCLQSTIRLDGQRCFLTTTMLTCRRVWTSEFAFRIRKLCSMTSPVLLKADLQYRFHFNYTFSPDAFLLFRRDRSGRKMRFKPIQGVLIGLSGPV